MSPPTSALVLGARGQLGRALLPRLADAGWDVHAVSRQAQPPEPGLQWHRLDLFAGEDRAPATDIVFSLGPLDGAASWFARSTRAPRAMVAFGSTSVHTKHDSPDPADRALAQRLRDAERSLAGDCAGRGTRLVVLRPTLVYGAGLDRNLTRIAGLAKRRGFFVLPRGATGLRQPVHVDDLAAAALRCAESTVALAPAYDLPGGESLPWREMVARVLACLDPPAKLIELPSSPLRAALWCAHRVGLLGDAGAGVWSRLVTDLVFDAQPARRDFGYAPRGFDPRAAMFDPAGGMLHRTM
jgi:nucleoside-diphosphate-sugar epimerase